MRHIRLSWFLFILMLSGCALDRQSQLDTHEQPWPPLSVRASMTGPESPHKVRVVGPNWFEELGEVVNVFKVTNLQLLSASPNYDVLNDEQMTYLSQLPNLERLSIINGSITDAGLRHVAECKNLRRAYLDNLQITDAGLMHFEDTPKLEWLGIIGSVTNSGIEALQKARPNLEIDTVPRL